MCHLTFRLKRRKLCAVGGRNDYGRVKLLVNNPTKGAQAKTLGG
jgi:hypothetical protein